MADDNALYSLGNLASLAGMSGFDDFQDQSGGVDPEFDATLRDAAPDAGETRLSRFMNPSQLPGSAQGVLEGGLQAPESFQIEQSDLVPQSMKTGSSVGVSASGRGFSETKAKQVDKRDKLLSRDIQAADQTAQDQFSGAQPSLDAAKRSALTAAEMTTQAQVQKITGEALAAQQLADINNKFGLAEEEINAHYTSKQNQAQMDYVQALNDFRASRVDPNQMWKNMSGGERFGTLVSAFVHDFLGAKGIKTTAMASLNSAIDRNISAQEYAIKTKGEAAQGFKTLWEMQRSQSQSDAEARGRVRGFMLESVKQSITANMAQYEAGLATAQGQAAIAKVDEAYAQNLIEVYKEIAKNTAQLRGQAIQWNAEKLQAANASWANSLRAQELAFQKDQANKKRAVDGALKAGDFLIDPETNQGRWVFKDGVDDKTKADTKDTLIGIAEVSKTIADLRAWTAEVGANPDLLADTRFMQQTTRKIDAFRRQLAHSMVKANGEKATDKDVQEYLKSLPMDTWLTNGGVDEILAYAQKRAIEPGRLKVQQHTYDVPEAAQPRGATGMPFAGAYTDAENAGRKEKPTVVSIANDWMTTPDQNDAASKADISKIRDMTKVEPEARFKEFKKETGTKNFLTRRDLAVIGLADKMREGDEDAKKTLEKWANDVPLAKWELYQPASEMRGQSKMRKPKKTEYEMAKDAGLFGK